MIKFLNNNNNNNALVNWQTEHIFVIDFKK